MSSRDRIFLVEVMAAAHAWPGFGLRVFVVAWGLPFAGTIISADEYGEALLKSVAALFKPSPDFVVAQALEQHRAELLDGVRAAVRDANTEYVHLKQVAAAEGRMLALFRIPLDEVQTFSLVGPASEGAGVDE